MMIIYMKLPVLHNFKGKIKFPYVDLWTLKYSFCNAGVAAGIYSGLTYGLKEARGAHDWVVPCFWVYYSSLNMIISTLINST